MAITEKTLSAIVEDVNICLRDYYSEIESIRVCKVGNKYAIEPVIDGKQIDNFYKTMSKRDLYNALQVLKTVMFNCACSHSKLYKTEKKANTQFIKHLLQTFNEFGVKA